MDTEHEDSAPTEINVDRTASIRFSSDGKEGKLLIVCKTKWMQPITIDDAYGQMGDMACTYAGWKKWHIVRSYGTTYCGRIIYGREVYIIRRDMLDDDQDMCLSCATTEYGWMH